MNPEKSSDVTVQTLLDLRKEPEAVRLITERLRVKEMGPADHIRTKHEVKAFVEMGDSAIAQTILQRARERRQSSQNFTAKVTQRRGLRA